MTGREETAMSESNTEERKIPAMISVFAYEAAMTHKDLDNERLSKECERLHKLIRVLIAIILSLIVIFVTTYTIRTKFWLNTFERFIRSPVVEVQNAGVYNQSDQ